MLTYLRGVDQSQYLRDLQRLLNAPDLQPHLKALLISWLGDLSDPIEEEWAEVRRLLLSDCTRPQMLQAMFGKAGWWPHLQRDMQNRLERSDEAVDRDWMPYLSSVADVAQEDVIALIEPYQGRNEIWNARVARVLEAIRDWRTPAAVRLYDRHVRQLERVDLRELYLLPLAAEGDPGDPPTVCRLLKYILDGILDTAEEYTAQLPDDLFPRDTVYRALSSLRDDYSLTEALKTVSRRSPLLFFEQAIPWIERVVVLSGDREPHPDMFRHDALAYGWYFGVDRFITQFVRAVRDALQALSETDTETFKREVERLSALPYMTCQRLVAVAYTAVPERYARPALDFLLADSRRFRLGDQDEYNTQKLIQAVCPYLSAEQKAHLEATILAYWPQFELKARDRVRFRELKHLKLLGAMSMDHLTAAGRKRLQELERKYGEYRVPEHSASMVIGEVKSPISAEAIPRMRNVHWMHAIAKYSEDVEHRDILRGGVDELARDLAEWAKQHPGRARDLGMQLPTDTDARYVGALTRGLSE